MRKKRSQSFSNNASPPEPSGFRVQLEKTRKSTSPTADRQVPPAAPATPPTQRYTVPLKGSASAGPQRAGSLRREKTEDRISTSFSSRSTSSASARPFSSVGRRSKLAKEFSAEFLKQAKQSSSAGTQEDTSGPPAAAGTGVASNQPRTSSPIRQPVPLQTPVMTQPNHSVEVKSGAVGSKTEEEDSLSDAGTYTIEADLPDKELEEERKKIDQASIGTEVDSFDNSLNLKVPVKGLRRRGSTPSPPCAHRDAAAFVPGRCSACLGLRSKAARVKLKRRRNLGLISMRAGSSVVRLAVWR